MILFAILTTLLFVQIFATNSTFDHEFSSNQTGSEDGIAKEQKRVGRETFENGQKYENSTSNTSLTAEAKMPGGAYSFVFLFFLLLLFGLYLCLAVFCIFAYRNDLDLKPETENRSPRSVNPPAIKYFSTMEEPFSSDKLYCLKFDQDGNCYASPLGMEVPPPPKYEDACTMTSPEQFKSLGTGKSEIEKF